MDCLELTIYGKKILRTKSKPVEEFEGELSEFFDRMVETMIVEGGVGLAAPQVGVSKQIAVINPEPENEKTLIRMINPRIVSCSSDDETMEEGCLSIPGIRANVVRYSSLDVVYQDINGTEHTLHAEGLLARIIQHEIDHLNGILFIDHLSLAKRALLRSKLRDLKKGIHREC
jgi:peptide deformylase